MPISGTSLSEDRYRYKLGSSEIDCSDSSGYSEEIDIRIPLEIQEAAFSGTSGKLCLLGHEKDVWQPYPQATVFEWIYKS
jgi:hypothetical protein